jgi:hypothetical protein
MQVFDINLKPGESRPVDVQASYIYFLNGSAGGVDSTISVTPTGGGETVYLKPGQAYKMAGAAPVMARWTIANLKGEGTIIGQVLMGEGEFSDNRVSGSVEVIDGGKARTYANVAFMGNLFQAGQANNFSAVQLFNPAGSAKNLVVQQIGMTSGNSASGFGISFYNAQLPTVGAYGKSKKSGGPDSVARMASGIVAAVPGTTLCGIDTATKNCKFTEPLVIAPGWGAVVTNVTLATDTGANLSATFEYYEEPV